MTASKKQSKKKKKQHFSLVVFIDDSRNTRCPCAIEVLGTKQAQFITPCASQLV